MKNILLFTLLIFCLLACRKEVRHLPVSIEANKLVLQRFCYKAHSYWIMKDSISGQTDSFYITKSGNNYNDFYGYYRSRNDTTWHVISLDMTQQDSAGNKTYWLWEFTGDDMKIMEHSPEFFQRIYTCGLYTAPFPIVHSSYNLNGNLYSNVYGSYCAYDKYDTFLRQPIVYDDTMLFCESAGILQMNLNHPSDTTAAHQVWQLLRKNTLL